MAAHKHQDNREKADPTHRNVIRIQRMPQAERIRQHRRRDETSITTTISKIRSAIATTPRHFPYPPSVPKEDSSRRKGNRHTAGSAAQSSANVSLHRFKSEGGESYQNNARSSPYRTVHQRQQRDDSHRRQRQAPEKGCLAMGGGGSIAESPEEGSGSHRFALESIFTGEEEGGGGLLWHIMTFFPSCINFWSK